MSSRYPCIFQIPLITNQKQYRSCNSIHLKSWSIIIFICYIKAQHSWIIYLSYSRNMELSCHFCFFFLEGIFVISNLQEDNPYLILSKQFGLLINFCKVMKRMTKFKNESCCSISLYSKLYICTHISAHHFHTS